MKLLSGYAKKDKLFDEMRKYNVLAAHEMEIHSDLSLKNVIQSCLDFDKPQAMFEKANYFLEVIFNMEPTQPHNAILMGLWEQIISFKFFFKSYSKFFHSIDNQEISTTTFGTMYSLPPWAYQVLPLNGEHQCDIILNTEAVQKKYGQELMKMNASSTVIDFFSEIDKDNKNPK
mgnify:CR=1 FL=1